MIQAAIRSIEYYLPEKLLTNDELALQFPEWSAQKIEDKTGIVERHIASENECASDLGVLASKKLFDAGVCHPEEIDYVLFCTQSPDYFLPTTACLIQNRLGIPTTAGAVDFNLGCSGYVYGLSLAKGLIETRQAARVLLITAETYSKYIHPDDKSTRTLFGDAAAATLVEGSEIDNSAIGPFVFGTDGQGASALIVTGGAQRNPQTNTSDVDLETSLPITSRLYMNGSGMFTFALRTVPKVVEALLSRAELGLDDIDLYVFHQANLYMLNYLRKKLKIPPEKFYLALREYGNTVSSTIPIALKEASQDGTLHPGHRVMILGFGVGFSWGAALLRWVGNNS
jgi:3-oxoacyl-[acyl-carrier-protein] synthase-3